MVLVVPAWSSGSTVAKSAACPRICGGIFGKDCLILRAGVAGLSIRLGLAILLDTIVGDAFGRLRVRHNQARLHEEICVPEDETSIGIRHKATNRDTINIDRGVFNKLLSIGSHSSLE